MDAVMWAEVLLSCTVAKDAATSSSRNTAAAPYSGKPVSARLSRGDRPRAPWTPRTERSNIVLPWAVRISRNTRVSSRRARICGTGVLGWYRDAGNAAAYRAPR